MQTSSPAFPPDNGESARSEAALQARGISLRPERADDAAFLAALFRSTMASDLALMRVDDAVKDSLVQMQFASQTATYRNQYPSARFDIVEQHGNSIGRLIFDPGGEAGCIVDFALLPQCRGQGLGTAILADAVAWFAATGKPVRCMVLMTNQPSLRMCRRAGFAEIGASPPFVHLEWRP